MAMPLRLWYHIAISFHDFILVCSFSYLLCFDGLWNWFGKRKVDINIGELCGTQQVMKDANDWCMCKGN